MKINHTPFGVLSSNKKLVAGAVALALVSGITPAVISKTHALEAPVPVSSIEETLYTTVGPEYFTITDLYVSDYSDYNIRVADTSVAEVYDGSSSPSPISGKVELESSKFVSNDAMSVDAGNMLLRGASTKNLLTIISQYMHMPVKNIFVSKETKSELLSSSSKVMVKHYATQLQVLN